MKRIKTTNYFAILVIFGFIFSGCSVGPTDVTADIEAANVGFEAAYSSGDMTAMANCYTGNGIMYPPNSDVISGFEDIKNYWQGAYDMGLNKVELQTISATGFGDIAYEDGTYNLFMGDMEVDHGKYMVIWHKVNGEWKLHQDIWNSSVPQSNNAANIKKGYEAFAKGDIPGILALLDENIEWNEAESFPYADGNPYVGHDAVVQGVFTRIGAEWDYWNLVDKSFYEMKNDMVLVTGWYDAKHKKSGKTMKAQFAHVWTIENGKATSFQQYADTKKVLATVK